MSILDLITSFIIAAVISGTPLLFGTTGEILTEKSGNLNLGVEGLMYMGGAFGLAGAFAYEQAMGENVNGIVAVIIAMVCSFIAGAFGSLIYSFLTITLKANQNVTGLALTMFGTGVGQFVGENMRIKVGGYVALSNNVKGYFANSPFPSAWQTWQIGKFQIGKLLFGYNFFVYFGLAVAVMLALFFKKTRTGLYLTAVGENPATADSAGISVEKYKYIATIIGGGISGFGGMVYTMTTAACVWNNSGLDGVGWLSVALVIFCLWKPFNTIWSAVLFGALSIMYLYLHLSFIPTPIYKIVPYIVTVIVLILVSSRQRREDQPPAALGLAYFREER